MSLMVTETWAASFYVNFHDLLSWPQVGTYRVNIAGKSREGLGKRELDKDEESATQARLPSGLLNVRMEETSHFPVEKQECRVVG